MNTSFLKTTIFVAAIGLCSNGLAEPPSDAYLSDGFQALNGVCQQQWGKPGINTTVVPPDGRPASPLRIGETVYEKGLGLHAPSEAVFELPEGEYAALVADIGIPQQGGHGSVVFQVFVDGEQRFDSGVMSDKDAARTVNLPVTGARQLRLVVTDAGDGIACDVANWANARLVRDPNALRLGAPSVTLSGQPAPEPSGEVCGLSLIAHDTGPQVFAQGANGFAACVREGEDVTIEVPIANVKSGATLETDATLKSGESAGISLALDGAGASEQVLTQGRVHLQIAIGADVAESVLRLRTSGGPAESLVEWRNVRIVAGERQRSIPVLPPAPIQEVFPPRVLPALRPAMEQALLEWDWRMQDGIGTEREPVTYAVAIERLLERGDGLLRDLTRNGTVLDTESAQWQALHDEYAQLSTAQTPDDQPQWEDVWKRVHDLRRRVVLANPLADVGPLVFAKQVPGAFSHQLTQYYGYCARAGGGLFVLDAPGQSMQCRELVSAQLPRGSYMLPEVTYDASRILFAYCEVPKDPTPENKEERLNWYYHLFEVRPDGSGLRQMTEGAFDDFCVRELPNGKLIMASTRRGGFHRCGAGPCPVYTLALAESDGSNPRTVSYHETNEWDPAVLDDGRVIYTRWDYVDRNAVHYQQLWTVKADGSAPMAYYGNNTFSPVGVWEARQVPDSPFVMATAAAHHAMTAGSIILLDTRKGVDGPAPITRITPDAPFPESETTVPPANWHAPGSPIVFDTPEEARRWPGHCYRSPYPLSEKYFLAAYSFDSLIGEPIGNKPNMFGLYIVDAFGNKELLYRDLNIASVWPVPIRPRVRPPALPAVGDGKTMDGVDVAKTGTFFLRDVHASNPALPKDAIKRLRIVQVLPKTTPNANQPPVGFANASPGKQVLGTVPVEPDGSAYFKAPAGIPISFQALDEQGRAIQTMRTITYLQPGESMSCVGCHEHRLSSPPRQPKALALNRPASEIEPGPDGSKPLSYPLLVQPVLDRLCVKCHSGDAPAGPENNPIVLTGEPEGQYSKSYNVLAKRVPFSSWGKLDENGEPATQPERFGARASGLMKMLLEGHQKVELNDEDRDRLITWMDANALFYGTFNPDDQARQLRGERIAGAALE